METKLYNEEQIKQTTTNINNCKSYENEITQTLREEFLNKKGNHKKVYAVMLFDSEFNLGISSNPYKWINTKNHLTTDGSIALYLYSEIPCPASQLIEAFSLEELNYKMIQMYNNFNNENWLNNNLYPYL